jgi:hypothetical protein
MGFENLDGRAAFVLFLLMLAVAVLLGCGLAFLIMWLV